MLRAFSLIVCAIIFALVPGDTWAADSQPPGWLKLEQSGVTLEYQKDMEDMARQLLPVIAGAVDTQSLSGWRFAESVYALLPR